MIILNWIPELAILVQLFITLVFLTFKPPTYRSLPLIITAFSSAVLIYFAGRTDLAYFTPFEKVLISDSLSYFGRIVSLLILIFGSLCLHLNRNLSYESKQKGNLFLLFLAGFLNTIVLSNSILLFAVGWVGFSISISNFILVESRQNVRWIQTIRQRSYPFAVSIGLLLCLYAMFSGPVASPYLSDYFEWLKTMTEPTTLTIATGGLVLILGTVLTHSMMMRGRGPLGLALNSIGLFVAVSIFWFRIGIPFFTLSNLLPILTAQHLVGFVIATAAIKWMWQAIRSTEHDSWLSAIYASAVGLAWFMLVLKGDYSLPAFYSIGLSLLVAFFFSGYAFQETSYQNKILILTSIVALLGAPPFELGFQHFRLIHDAIGSELVFIAMLATLVWFGMSISSIQMLGKVILIKNGKLTFRPLYKGEVFYLVLIIVSVILLTAYRPALISLLNDHPAPYLW